MIALRLATVADLPVVLPRTRALNAHESIAVTDEVRAAASSAELDEAAERLAEQVARLRGGMTPVRMSVAPTDTDLTTLHERAHALAGRALVVAASRADTAAAILAAEQMDVHAAALEPRELASH